MAWRNSCAAGRHRLPPPGSDAGTVRVRLYAVAPAAIIGGLQLGPFMACTDGGYSIGMDHGAQDRREDNRPRTVGHSDRPSSHGWPHPMPSRRSMERRAIASTHQASPLGDGRSFRAARPLSRVMCVRTKTRPEAVRTASAMSTRSAQRQTERLTSRLTGDRLTPTDAAAKVRRRRVGFATRRRGAPIGRAVRRPRVVTERPILHSSDRSFASLSIISFASGKLHIDSAGLTAAGIAPSGILILPFAAS
jgi:hypothetical protein